MHYWSWWFMMPWLRWVLFAVMVVLIIAWLLTRKEQRQDQ